LHQRLVSRAFRIDRALGRGKSRRRVLFGQRRIAPGGAHTIDETLREHRAQPGRETAAAVEVAKEGAAAIASALDAQQLGVDVVCEILCAAGGVECRGGASYHRAYLAHEMVPGRFVSVQACRRQREILQMKRLEIAFEVCWTRRTLRTCRTLRTPVPSC